MDMKSRSGDCLTLGIRSPISGSSTQKVNPRSLTKSKLVGTDNAIGFLEWVSLYSKEQVKEYRIKHLLKELGKKDVVIVLQDNINTIRLVKGGRRVCGSKTRSICIRYF